MWYALKQAVPEWVKRPYHRALAFGADRFYAHPSEHLMVIGVTGTNGKSSTVIFVAQLLTLLGETVGYTTTAGFSIAGKKVENRMKMTMPGRFALQKYLKEMVRADCRYAIVETSSQGLMQYRHLGVHYDVAVFTNLTPEHIEAHGGFDAYKQAKGVLFSHLSKSPNKVIGGKLIEKVSVLNRLDPHAAYFAQFPVDREVWYAMGAGEKTDMCATVTYENADGAELEIRGTRFRIPFRAAFEWQNALAAIATVHALGFSLSEIAAVSARMQQVPGRFQFVKSNAPFDVIVDYAYEPYALAALFASVNLLHPRAIIGVHGSAGGGRDVARRGPIGKMAAEHEAIVVVTNEDPYDEDPRAIIDAVAQGAREAGKKDEVDLFRIEDRKEAIQFAISQAQEGDVVVITGKGSEPVMAVSGGKKIPWSDIEAAQEALRAQGYVCTLDSSN